jgi:hypothetical protein
MKTILRWIHDLLPCPNEPRKFWTTHRKYCYDHYQDLDEPGLWGDTYEIVSDDTDCERCIDEFEDEERR